MINSVITIGGHLVNRTLCDEDGNEKTLPDLYPYLYQFKLQLVDIGSDGAPHVVFPNVDALSCSIGLVYADPRAGTFRLRYGAAGAATEDIDFKEDAADFKTKLGALAESEYYQLNEVFQAAPCTWMCRFDNLVPDLGHPVPIPLQMADNQLDPVTFIRIRQFFQGEEYWLEVRLMQGPVASTSAHETILADPPVCRLIRFGFTQVLEGGLETIVVNEIQAIYVPPGFAGTYIIKFAGRQTRPLSASDGAATIASALNGLYTGDNPPVIRFLVTNPEENNAYVEFVGPLGGRHFENLQIIVASEGHSSLFFSIDLNTAEVAEVLRRGDAPEMTMEITLHVSDPNDDHDPGQDLVLFQAPVVIRRPLHWEGLLAAQPINWLLPPNPVDYIPFDREQVFTGPQTYSARFGDGIFRTFSFDHMLNSDAISVEVRERVVDGRRLHDDEYEVVYHNANNIVITIPEPLPVPGVNALVAVFFSSGTVMAFRDHSHVIANIVGLTALTDEILIRLSALEAYLPTIPAPPPAGRDPFGGQGATDILQVGIPDLWNVAPTNRPPGNTDPGPSAGRSTTAGADPLPTAGLMLPAVHDAIKLGFFTADPGTDIITLVDPVERLVAGQRVRIDPPQFYEIGTCTFDTETDTVTTIMPVEHGLVEDRKVKFTGGILPGSISPTFIYYVINPTPTTFQVSSTRGGPLLPLAGSATSAINDPHFYWSIPEVPGGLTEATDYFVYNPSGGGSAATETFQLSSTLAGATSSPFQIIDIEDEGYPPYSITSIADAPPIDTQTNRLPVPTAYAGHAFSVRQRVQLNGGRGIRATVANPEDIIASDGRIWYPVTRSDSPGKNSFYPTRMEQEIFRLAINDRMLPAQSVFTLTWDILLRMYKHTTNAQYLMVCEWADLPSTLVPDPTGPNLYAVAWHKVPILSQKVIVTEIPINNHFGVQVVRLPTGILKTNKKAYSVQVAGDSIPTTANFALRCRLIEFDTEDNVKDAVGLVYYSLKRAVGQVTLQAPEAPPELIPFIP